MSEATGDFLWPEERAGLRRASSRWWAFLALGVASAVVGVILMLDLVAAARTLAMFGGFTEGLQLFASFAILMNFPRFNKMKGMGQIVTWSVRDESLHTASIIKLFRTFLSENPEIWNEDFQRELYVICDTVVEHEDAFIDLAFEQGPVPGMTAKEIKRYIRYIADWRLGQLGLPSIYMVDDHPLPWLAPLLNGVEHANFFETRATEYSKAATKGKAWKRAKAAVVVPTAKNGPVPFSVQE